MFLVINNTVTQFKIKILQIKQKAISNIKNFSTIIKFNGNKMLRRIKLFPEAPD